MRVFAYQSRQYLLALHGTVLTADARGTIILAGSSGSGKSTLAAALLARGFTLVSDEPVVIADDNNLLSMPLSLGLKNGSWPILLPEYPELDRLPVHVRFDGQQIRYLPPSIIPVAPNNSGCPADKLVFARYLPAAAGKLEQLTIVQTLNRILEAGYQVPGLDEERVLAIINWLTGIDRYSLTYPSKEEAVRLFGEQLAPLAAGVRSCV